MLQQGKQIIRCGSFPIQLNAPRNLNSHIPETPLVAVRPKERLIVIFKRYICLSKLSSTAVSAGMIISPYFRTHYIHDQKYDLCIKKQTIKRHSFERVTVISKHIVVNCGNFEREFELKEVSFG